MCRSEFYAILIYSPEKCIAILTFTKIINGIRYPNQENHNNRTQKKKWKLLFSIDFRRCSTFVSCVQKHISNVIYHALCGKDYQQKSKHFFSSQMKFGEFGSIWLASDLFFFCGWTVQSNRPTAHFAFVLSFMLFVCCWKSSYSMHSNAIIISGYSRKRACKQPIAVAINSSALLIGFSFCSRLLYVIYHRNYAVTLTEVF